MLKFSGLINIAWLLSIPIYAQGDWHRYTLVNSGNGQVSFNNVRNVLEAALGSSKVLELENWTGPVKNGFAEGSGEVKLKALLSEASGTKKFVKTVTLEGLMQRGIFRSELRVTVADNHLMDRHTKIVYSDGLMQFVSRKEYQRHMLALEQVNRDLGARLATLERKSISQSNEEKFKAAAAVIEKSGNQEAKSIWRNLAKIYKQSPGSWDLFAAKAFNAIRKSIGKAPIKGNLYVYGAYIVYSVLWQWLGPS